MLVLNPEAQVTQRESPLNFLPHIFLERLRTKGHLFWVNNNLFALQSVTLLGTFSTGDV